MNMQAGGAATPSNTLLLLTKPALLATVPKDNWHDAWPMLEPTTMNALQSTMRLQEVLASGQLQNDQLLAMHWPVFALDPMTDGMALLQSHLAMLRHTADCERHMLVMVSPSTLLMAAADIKPWPNKLWCGVMGKQSAAVAMRLGIPEACLVYPGSTYAGHIAVEEDSMGLASIIAQQFNPQQLKLMVAKGPQGRTEYLHHLRQLGFVCETLNIYERKPIPADVAAYQALLNIMDTHHAKIKVVIWFSSSDAVAVWAGALNQLSANQAERLLQSVVVIATHRAIAAQCRKMGFAQVVQTSPGIQSVKRCLQLI